MNRMKWTYDLVKIEASKFNTSGEFKKGSPRAYYWACSHKILNDFFVNVQSYWTEDDIRKSASKYSSKNEFKHGDINAYQAALRKHMINELFDNKLKSWDKDSVINESYKYKSKREFKLNNPSAYRYALKNGLIDNLYDNVYITWTPESVKELSLKCSTKKEFYENYSSAYQYACRYDLLKTFTWLMSKNDTIKRCIYVYIDEENKVAYVGLTSNKEERHISHSTGLYKGEPTYSAVFNYFKSINKNIPEPIYLKEDLSLVDAQKMEDMYKKEYESKGYMMLNTGKTGVGTGSVGWYKWNKEMLFEEASKYKSKIELYRNNRGAYDYAINHGYINELYDNIKRTWNDNIVIEEARKYKNKYSFKKGCSGAYSYAERHNLLKELFPTKK